MRVPLPSRRRAAAAAVAAPSMQTPDAQVARSRHPIDGHLLPNHVSFPFPSGPQALSSAVSLLIRTIRCSSAASIPQWHSIVSTIQACGSMPPLTEVMAAWISALLTKRGQSSVFASFAPSQQLQCACLVLLARSSIRACDLQKFVAHAAQASEGRALRGCLDTLVRLESIPSPLLPPLAPETRRTSAFAQREAARGSLFRCCPPLSKRKRANDEDAASTQREKKSKTNEQQAGDEIKHIYNSISSHSVWFVCLQSLSRRWPAPCAWYPIATPATL